MSAPHPTKAEAEKIRAKVRELALAGASIKEIGYAVGRSHVRTATIIRKVGLRRVFLTESEREMIAQNRRAA
jgi:hypothetical protein